MTRPRPLGPKGRRLWASHRRHIRKRVIARDGLVCWLCGKPIAKASDVTMDHVHPAKFGGLYEVDNLRPAHRACNFARGHNAPF